jgi:hypothetical protein
MLRNSHDKIDVAFSKLQPWPQLQSVPQQQAFHAWCTREKINNIRVALIGCGGRGTGAADNALSVENGPIQLVAMADVFDYKLKQSFDGLKEKHKDKVDVSRRSKVRRFRWLQESNRLLCDQVTSPSWLPHQHFER